MIKRCFDLLVAAFGLIILSPFIIILAWRIKRDSPGPVLYRGARIGYGGSIFQILKFRTMYETTESYSGSRVTAQDDERVTSLGHWLRDTKLNELPQLWNVLKGEMSLVGPRPEDPQITDNWPDQVRREILSVRPGVTSPASVLYRDEEALLSNHNVMDTYLNDILPSKLRLDQLYVRHHSFWSDLDILFWTLLVLLPRVGRYSPPEKFLFLGPFSRLMQRHVSWFLADALVTFIAMGITGLFFRTIAPLNVGWGPAFILALGYAMLFSLANYFLGVNHIVWSQAAASDAIDLVPGALLSSLVAMLINYLWPAGLLGVSSTGAVTPWGTEALLPTSMLLMSAMLAFIGFILIRYRTRLITGLAMRWLALRGNTPANLERVLIIGGGETGQFAAWMLKNNHKYSDTLQVIGFVDDDLFKQGVRIRGLNILGQRADIPQLVVKYDIGVLVFAIHNISVSERQRVLDICASTPARLMLFPNISAALNSITYNHPAEKGAASGNGHKPNGKPIEEMRQAAARTEGLDQVLPCDLCMIKVSPLKIDGWLAQLEEVAHSGDLERLMELFQALRSEVHGDVEVQRAANINQNHAPLPEGKVKEG